MEVKTEELLDLRARKRFWNTVPESVLFNNHFSRLFHLSCIYVVNTFQYIILLNPHSSKVPVDRFHNLPELFSTLMMHYTSDALYIDNNHIPSAHDPQSFLGFQRQLYCTKCKFTWRQESLTYFGNIPILGNIHMIHAHLRDFCWKKKIFEISHPHNQQSGASKQTFIQIERFLVWRKFPDNDVYIGHIIALPVLYCFVA